MSADNSWGRGYYPLPPHLAGLGRFADCLRPTNLIDHKVYPDDRVDLLTVKADHGFSIMGLDLDELRKLGLVRIQCNEPGTIGLYFFSDPGGSLYPQK